MIIHPLSDKNVVGELTAPSYAPLSDMMSLNVWTEPGRI
jgi:hypothetical protein